MPLVYTHPAAAVDPVASVIREMESAMTQVCFASAPLPSSSSPWAHPHSKHQLFTTLARNLKPQPKVALRSPPHFLLLHPFSLFLCRISFVLRNIQPCGTFLLLLCRHTSTCSLLSRPELLCQSQFVETRAVFCACVNYKKETPAHSRALTRADTQLRAQPLELTEYPNHVSTIKYFGRPILPPRVSVACLVFLPLAIPRPRTLAATATAQRVIKSASSKPIVLSPPPRYTAARARAHAHYSQCNSSKEATAFSRCLRVACDCDGGARLFRRNSASLAIHQPTHHCRPPTERCSAVCRGSYGNEGSSGSSSGTGARSEEVQRCRAESF